MPGEFDFIRWIQTQQQTTALVQLPAGDDLAVLRWNAAELLLAGVDQVLDGVHFDSTVHGPRLIGQKAMNRSLSDCAAMACLPAAALATVALPIGTPMDYAQQLYLGMKQAADAFDCQIVGGDVASWTGRLLLTVTVLGRSAGFRPITRAGARPGDMIFVTGPLGGSLRGRHMTFTPRITEGLRIGKTGCATAMIDLSDGLSSDLGHICQASGVGAVIEALRVPVHPDATLGDSAGMTPLDHALHDGEDYELLFTGPADAFRDFICLGRITAEKGIFLQQDGVCRPLEPRGWQHRF